MSLKASEKQCISSIRPIKVEGGRVLLIDQRKLPECLEYFDATHLDDMCFAIKEMIVRGAPAIGVAAALGLAAESRRICTHKPSSEEFFAALETAKDKLQSTRPTAVNLRWATESIVNLCKSKPGELPAHLSDMIFVRASEMIDEDIRINRAIGENGKGLIANCASVLTHCNAGALATCGWGTALGVIRSAIESGARLTVYVDETRPRQQGAKLTAWELLQDNIIPTLITDSTAGYLMSQGKVDAVIVGADRIAANGDTANKIGTYSLSVLANAHKIPFYVAAPLSTIDPHIAQGDDIPIEERDTCEVTIIGGKEICPPGISVFNPAFDVTPAKLISSIITEVGVLRPPYNKSIAQALSSLF